MNEVKKEDSKLELRTNLEEQVKAQISSLTTKIPKYSELTEEAKEIVDKYISTVDLEIPQTIDEFGKDETEKIYKELDMLIGTMKTHDTSIEDMFTELMMSIDENSEPQGENFLDLLKKSPITAIKSLKNKPKKMLANDRYRRTKVLTNIDEIREKLEGIRNELRMNAGKLDIMAQNSAEQYINTQYQIIALQELLRKIQEERAKETRNS